MKKLTREQTRTRHMGMGTGTAKSTRGLPVAFTTNCMVQLPDKYLMKTKFLWGLPKDIIKNLLKSRRVSTEHTSMDKLLYEVKAMESSIQAYHDY